MINIMERKQQCTPFVLKGVNSGQAQHLRSIDRKIRKRWNQLYFYRKGRIVPNQEDDRTKKINTEPTSSIIEQHANPQEIQQLKANRNREITIERIKRNNDIFFKKKRLQCDPHNKLIKHSSCSPKKISQQSPNKTEIDTRLTKSIRQQSKLPLMLQRRPKKLEKQMSIIEYLSCKDVHKIKVKQALKMQLKQQEKQKLISRMKGTKLYYKFIQQWKMPIYEIEPLSPSPTPES